MYLEDISPSFVFDTTTDAVWWCCFLLRHIESVYATAIEVVKHIDKQYSYIIEQETEILRL
jgi:hypothetical protein